MDVETVETVFKILHCSCKVQIEDIYVVALNIENSPGRERKLHRQYRNCEIQYGRTCILEVIIEKIRTKEVDIEVIRIVKTHI